jgi:hypothetical protein
MAEVPYQQAGQVRQLLNERENAAAYGQDDRVAAVDKQLAELGYTSEKQAAKAADAAEARAATTAEGAQPQGRTTRVRETTDQVEAKAAKDAGTSDAGKSSSGQAGTTKAADRK